MFQPKGPRPLLVTEKIEVALLDPRLSWNAMDLCGQLWIVTQPHTQALCSWGRRPPLDTRSPGSQLGLRPLFTWGPCRLCCGILALFSDLGLDQGGNRQGSTCLPGPSGARPWTAAASQLFTWRCSPDRIYVRYLWATPPAVIVLGHLEAA